MGKQCNATQASAWCFYSFFFSCCRQGSAGGLGIRDRGVWGTVIFFLWHDRDWQILLLFIWCHKRSNLLPLPMVRTGSGSSAWFHLESVLEMWNAVSSYWYWLAVLVPYSKSESLFFYSKIALGLAELVSSGSTTHLHFSELWSHLHFYK